MTKRVYLILLCYFFLCSNNFSQNPSLFWTAKIGGINPEYAFSSTIDINNNNYICGSFSSTIDFDPGPGGFNMSAISSDIYILKLGPAGNFGWAKQMASSNTSSFGMALAIGVDLISNVYIAGLFRGTVDFDPGPGTHNLTSLSLNTQDMFIAKLDSSGGGSFGSNRLIHGLPFLFGLKRYQLMCPEMYI